MVLVLLIACAQTPPSGLYDTAQRLDPGDTGDTAVGPPSCEAPVSGSEDLRGVLLGLETYGCLAEADIARAMAEAIAHPDPSRDHEVVRLRSSDGRWFTDPELVVDLASVPTAWIDADGAHWLAYNDKDLASLESLLRDAPERAWQVGLPGVGGIALLRLAPGETEWTAEALDLGLARPSIVVDPDLGTDLDGNARWAWFGAAFDEVEDPFGDPYAFPAPHRYAVARGPEPGAPEGTTLAVASRAGRQGGADPTVQNLPDGREVLWVGMPEEDMPGWTSDPAGEWTPEAAPDRRANARFSAPNLVADPAGGWRGYGHGGDVAGIWMRVGPDGTNWSAAQSVADDPTLSSPSVVRDADGTWWLYASRSPR